MPEKKFTDKEIEELVEENRRLKTENVSMQKVLNSRRFRAAEKIANVFNAVLPEGSVRRKTVSSMRVPIKVYRNAVDSVRVKKIERLIASHNKVVVMHSIPWNTPLKQRPHHLARCLAECGAMVIYLEPDEPIKKMRTISSNFITINSWDVLFQLKLSAKRNYYFFFNNVSNIPFSTIRKIKDFGYGLVYEYIDEFHEDISGSLVNQLETWKKLKTDKPKLVLASANKLYEEAKKHFKGVDVLLSKNAVVLEDFDFHRFKDVDTPSDLAEVMENKKPVVGYYGALAPWLDYELISKTAINNPDYNFVLIGVNYQNALKKLDQSLKNIYYLGPKKYADLPKYSSKFDCAIIPFGLGEIAKGTSPVKLFEYMAMGLPTVVTKDLKECEGYDYVYLAKNEKDFSDKLKLAIRESKKSDVKEKLRTYAEDNTWMKRAEDIMAEL